MTNIATDFIAAFAALHRADAQDMLTAAKHAISQWQDDDGALGDCIYATLDHIQREAQERVDFGDEPDPMLHDVLACISEFYN